MTFLITNDDLFPWTSFLFLTVTQPQTNPDPAGLQTVSNFQTKSGPVAPAFASTIPTFAKIYSSASITYFCTPTTTMMIPAKISPSVAE